MEGSLDLYQWTDVLKQVKEKLHVYFYGAVSGEQKMVNLSFYKRTEFVNMLY